MDLSLERASVYFNCLHTAITLCPDQQLVLVGKNDMTESKKEVYFSIMNSGAPTKYMLKFIVHLFVGNPGLFARYMRISYVVFCVPQNKKERLSIPKLFWITRTIKCDFFSIDSDRNSKWLGAPLFSSILDPIDRCDVRSDRPKL